MNNRDAHTKHRTFTALHRAVMSVIYTATLLAATPSTAQIVIKGNVYGGGNQGDLNGNTKVELRGGMVKGSVFGGARMADVNGRAYVHINGAEATDTLVVKDVYGGNDIAGTVGNTVGTGAKLPFGVAVGSGVDTTWNAFVQATAQSSEKSIYPFIIGSLYGGGNGDYTYVPGGEDEDGKVQVYNSKGEFVDLLDATGGVTLPTLAKTYLHIGGGVYGHIYGGGNAVTVAENTVIHTDNQTSLGADLNRLPSSYAAVLGDLFAGVDYRTDGDNMVFDYHASRLFGGNNKDTMNIRPTWSLKRADINNLYSGGNRGMMTHPNGIVLPIQSDDLRANNVYGGCRIADVNPGELDGAATLTAETLYGHDFTAGYATRVFITAGRINNVYGGNDISGKVYHGSNVDIHGAISGNVYGGGNGSYAYTDNAAWAAAHPEDADLLYSTDGHANSVEALYHHRPHVESTLVHIAGDNSNDPVVVAGDVYCGGNSATLAKNGNQADAKATFKIGKHAIINGVFLGSNGVNMVTPEVLKKYKAVDENIEGDNKHFSAIDLTDSLQMARYMDGVAVNIKPELQWDDIAQTTHIGSLYFGGNKGSMTYEGMADITVPRDLIIYEKIVGGCNDAYVKAVTEGDTTYNAAYEGGLLEPVLDSQGKLDVKVNLNVDAYLKPMQLLLEKDGHFVRDWDFVWDVTDTIRYETFDNKVEVNRTFVDANIYGGCFNSGQVNGGTVINISKPLIHPDVYSDVEVAKVVINPEVMVNSPVEMLRATGEDVYGSALAVYGAGYGHESVVKGNTQINLTDSATVLLVFGGGEMGVVEGNTEVNFDLNLTPLDRCGRINAYKAYAGGYAGEVKGNTTLNLIGGGVMRAFAGACNANIGGYTTAIIGVYDEEQDDYPRYGMPYVTNAVFGGNDFGGHILGSTMREIEVKPYKQGVVATKKVHSQTYVKYNNGNIGKAIYGGSYGSYNYHDMKMYSRGNPLSNPDFTTVITDDDKEVITANTFVHMASKSIDSRDIIGQNTLDDPTVISGIVGGGRGYRNLPGYVRVNHTYVLLDGMDPDAARPVPIAFRVYGGGNLSVVDSTRVDAYSCYIDQIFGGTHGVKTITTEDNVAYNVGNTLINLYGDASKTDIFGAGANSGTDKATINLIEGMAHNVHGGAYTEGYTLETYINVPDTSTTQVNAIFGGGLGESESWPCDVGVSNITYASADATVEEGIFGGNNTARATTETNITISVPVKNKAGELREIYGAGYGSATVSGFTHVDLLAGAHVLNVHGGGKEGKVYNHYKYYGHTGNDAVDYAINAYYDNAPHRHANWINGTIQPEAEKTEPKTIDKKNTSIHIHQDAVVENSVFGGGEGSVASVSGETHVELLGGIVKGDIYGGGDAGTMPRMTDATRGYIAAQEDEQTIATLCAINGGQVRKVFGGGLIGNIDGDTHITIGRDDMAADAGSASAVGRRSVDDASFINGTPAIERNVYGGSERAKVSGTATIDMYDGYIGYAYDKKENEYTPVLDLDEDLAVHEFEDEGNVYGAGYGEGAVVINTEVNLHGGRVRNSVYGGGEIAAVGKGVVANDQNSATVEIPGSANVHIYGGLVEGDVFGGGRGYSYTYNYTGEQSPYQSSRVYTDGYVFGNTNVEIFRGTIGTTESLAKGKGNVFGGGNIGYVYSAGTKHVDEDALNVYTGSTVDAEVSLANKHRAAAMRSATGEERIDGHYYRVDDPNTAEVESLLRSEDCRVHISAGSKATADVKINNTDYAKGAYVPTEALNTLAYNAAEWNNLDMEGVTIRNAVFAGGNVSSGSDIVYANAVTVFGNATASVVDVFNRDLISIGGEHIGGLYGDGNLTFVDGYRELNITNYGTEHEKLNTLIAVADYDKLLSREKELYVPYNGKYKLLDGRMMNTIQRADFCGIFGSRVLLHGAQDRVPDEVDYTNYAINRVGEISLNKKAVGSTTRGNYFGIYNVANFFGALTSDVLFTDAREAEGSTTAADGSTSYQAYKEANLNKDQENNASADNVVAQASGVYLELVKELDADGNKVYGPITGVIQLDLLNVVKGEGGGYVYAKKEYGTPHKADNTAHHTLSDANQGAITQNAFYYDSDEYDPFMQTSGNFVNPVEVVVDDPYSATAHYWHIRGNFYVYDMYISAYAGTPQAFGDSISIPLPANNKDSEAFFVSVNPNKYAAFKADGSTRLAEGDSMQVGNKVYYLNTPITYREWSMLSAADQARFTDETTNEVSNSKGYLLNYGMSNPADWAKFEPTFKCLTAGVYGRRQYEENDLVGKTVVDNNVTVNPNTDATFETAYVVLEEVTFSYNTQNYHMFAGSYLPATIYNALGEKQSKFNPAYICNLTYQKSNKEYILNGELVSEATYQEIAKAAGGDVAASHFSPAYLCTRAGYYGGKLFEKDKSYSALEYADLSSSDRKNFTYNYDALDLLTFTEDPTTDFATDLAEYAAHGSAFATKDVDTQKPLTATAKLYVPRESNFNNLDTERIITVEYWIEPKDKAGLTDDMKEKHYVNIHLQFKSVQPEIATLATPTTVMPGSSIGLAVPSVTPGAYEVLGSGWEIYDNLTDATTHQNGMSFMNNNTPMYWYQNGHYVAYYTKTYLGRTYSNPVPLTVANYHRIGEVMAHKVNGKNEYMYIDHKDIVDRDLQPAKIYLDSVAYTSESVDTAKNDLDYLYDLFVASTDGRLENTVRNCYNLDFILRSDIDSAKYYKNTLSIGDADHCFSGNLHGNGHTISGLANSLFEYLCGKVYNLGVTGSFTGGGVADHAGEGGYAENCWVYTTGTPTMKAVLGEDGTVVNSYYRGDNGFTEGQAIPKTAAEFNKGEVTYLLNSFYQQKRNNSNADTYVEEYFADGDFRFANGTIPQQTDVRYEGDENVNGSIVPIYEPIFPDDYIYFGQALTYDKSTHDSQPTHVAKVMTDSMMRIVRNVNGNRVYRAPAYYMSKTMDKAYFNMKASFIDEYAGASIHHGLTAIDFTGYEDDTKILDYEGLADIALTGLTSNLLVYADSVGDEASYNQIKARLFEPVLLYDHNTPDGNSYKRVNIMNNASSLRGHLVQRSGNAYIATRNQFLVDKEDFNAPIDYTFADGCYMWYQRKPAYYSNGSGEGWESLCLPFDAEITTTQTKGQITHFYGTSTANHEYWLRKLNSVAADDGQAEALFQRPEEGSTTLTVYNTFLYDYYYSYNDQKDANGDDYQKYYNEKKEGREYENYPYVEAYVPYIVAFPGERYYEFDMSGTFVPKNSGEDNRVALPAQTVTFISKENATIGVTDDQLGSRTRTVGDYSYTGVVLSGTSSEQRYVIDESGKSFIKGDDMVPFRAYMTIAAGNAAPHRILIGGVSEDIEQEPAEEIADHRLRIYAKGEAICIESSLEYEATVTIYSLSGQIVKRMNIQPMSKVVVPVNSRGMYIVNQKKIAVL